MSCVYSTPHSRICSVSPSGECSVLLPGRGEGGVVYSLLGDVVYHPMRCFFLLIYDRTRSHDTSCEARPHDHRWNVCWSRGIPFTSCPHTSCWPVYTSSWCWCFYQVTVYINYLWLPFINRFTSFPTHKHPQGSTPSDITRHHMDLTYTLSTMLSSCYDNSM